MTVSFTCSVWMCVHASVSTCKSNGTCLKKIHPHHFSFFAPSSPILPLSTARSSVSDRRWWSDRRRAKMFITTNKPLHWRRPADTGSPWEMLLLQACPRLAPRVPSWLADAGEPSGATLAASVKWAERFFPQAQSDVVKPCEGNFFFPPFLKPPLPGSVIQSFDISAQGNGETCWGFTHSLPQTGCHYGNSTVDLSLNIFLEKCGLMHENSLPSKLPIMYHPTPRYVWVSTVEHLESVKLWGFVSVRSPDLFLTRL